MSVYKEYKALNLPNITEELLAKWAANNTFEKSVTNRNGATPFVFYEGPPSANGLPGIHHVMGRTIKDIFCRYKTLQGFKVERKAGWDTHGLPVELSVEKALGITKEDIGNKNSPKYISVEDYNTACRKEVMKYTDIWNDLTQKMGYWVDMKAPYVTYDNNYIESVWWLLQNLYKKNLIYKGYTIQPYSPAAGTGLSSHEINQPGCYRNVKDTSAVAMFKVSAEFTAKLSTDTAPLYFLAWTTTPWTLPSNTALAVGKNINYCVVKTISPYTFEVVQVIVAENLLGKYFSVANANLSFDDYKQGDKAIPYQVLALLKGSDLEGIRYQQLLPYTQPTDGDAFRVIIGDFVTTDDGTGIVHIAPSFGADDFRVAKQNGIGSLTLVDKRGKFTDEVNDAVYPLQGRYVKEAYLTDEEKATELAVQQPAMAHIIKELKNYLSADEIICLKLQHEGLLFKKEKYEHSYPHCWRTDKPILYYPLDSWFIKTTAAKDRLIALNKTINWKPEHTGTGRFGNWLENLNDWNLSRSRFWGIPLPIWRTANGEKTICIGSIEELKNEIAKANAAGIVNTVDTDNPNFDLHKPYIDNVVLYDEEFGEMHREADLIDVWFDSGAMPYAQLHYPFENKELIDEKKYYPADFIAEGVDQTRGWFFTLHAIAVLVFDSVAYKNVVSNGLVLDKNGNKMSKRLGNGIDPFGTLQQYGADATRWYMIANAAPWDNLKFDTDGITEVQRKLFGTIYNTYNFFAIYANLDAFTFDKNNIEPYAQRIELDQWIISKLNSLVADVTEALDAYEPHRAARAVEEFVDEHLSNWYVRLSRRRFWKGVMDNDKKAAYETLYECLSTLAQLMSPIAPFFSDWLHQNLSENNTSIHLTDWTPSNTALINKDLEERMAYAQKISSMVLSIRKKENLKVRQPLQKIQIPVLNADIETKIKAVADLILSEVNVKQLEFVSEADVQIVKNMKLNFKMLGKKYGKHMKAIQDYCETNSKTVIASIEQNGAFTFEIGGEEFTLLTEDIEIIPVDIEGWKVANAGSLTVALDVTLTPALVEEGISRELINRIQNIRKTSDLALTDKVIVKILANQALKSAIHNNYDYICTEILAERIEEVENEGLNFVEIEIDDTIKTKLLVEKI
ncbi:MAG: isoleucine--tRNA ligase [Bacteroidia bacterium]